MSENAHPDALGQLVAARELQELAKALAEKQVATASGLWGSSVAAVVASVRKQLARPMVLICGHLDEGDDLADDIELFLGQRPDVVPALELGGAMGRVSEEQVANRLRLITRLASVGPGQASPLLVAPIQALMQSVPAKSELKNLVRTLKVGDELESEKLIVWLADHGYNRLDQVEVPGDFAVRGGIVDIYLAGEFDQSDDQVGLPVRIDFFGDQIESIRTFNLETLGSGKTLDSIRVMDLKGQMDSVNSTHLFSYLPEETIVVLWEPLEIQEQAKSYFDRLPEVKGIYPLAALLKNVQPFARLELSQFGQGTGATTSLIAGEVAAQFELPVRSLQKFETEAKKAIGELAELAKTEDVTVFCENEGESNRFAELIDQDAPGLREQLTIAVGYLHRGFVWDTKARGSAVGSPTDRPLALVGHHELFHRYEMRRRVKRVIASRPVDSFVDLKEGDYVVHVAHGIAKFLGMRTIAKDGKNEEYLSLRFADNATLHVPAARINLVQKYIGGFHGHPQLSKLGSGVWEKQKAKVSEAVMDMAAELIEIQAARQSEVGTPYPPDTEWQREFEAEFPYEPTEDQVTSAEEIKQDMQRARPMDRLLCGDVGYGKTELAMRAAFKAAEYGKQVAVLVPTTVLAEQHYRSFRERMADYPFIVESISRFKTPREQKDIIKRTKAGEVDVLIGTHRLISKDINFSDLGLVVIDEEQRFGVTHKERLKQMRKTVDVLTMSATPIPRTLHMSMLGLRDISSLTTAPQDRRSVVTEVMPFDKARVKMAILRELNRDGQVYFVHNRVHNITEIADEIQQMVPDARIIIGHGQMEGGEMEEAMLKFIRHEADVLVCTTIIESGLDIPNANTIIINQADRFGLSELHQLRGRVGRWKHRAYCYLLLPADRPVTPVAAKRLKAVEEYSHLGAGFKIAMRDLEIRGAGNILGPEQSGHIATVGYEMYCQLLEECVRQLKNQPKPTSPEAHVDIGVSAFIPKTYIEGDRQRMDVYRRLTRCNSIEMLHMLEQDLKDAFGEPPKQVVILLALTELRLLASHFAVESIIKKDPDVIMTVREAAGAQNGLAGAPGRLSVIDPQTIYLRMPPTFMESETLLMVLRNLMRQAYDREKNGADGQPAQAAPAALPQAIAAAASSAAPASASKSDGDGHPTKGPRAMKKEFKKKFESAGAAPAPNPELDKLTSLRDAGILTPEEFEAARKRVLAKK
ncbi:MAG TPA: transcription-repair coupling factor [Tepidisphaeraceae bacterium]